MNLETQIKEALKMFWDTRNSQKNNQIKSGNTDQGLRGAATGGKQMQGFEKIAFEIAMNCGMPKECIHFSSKLELPGYYRPEKRWDMVIVDNNKLIAAIEFKSQVGPSFGNNFNNRTEEAIGTATDLWVAYREGAFAASQRPWLGYLFVLENHENSIRPVSLKETHFPAFKEFKDSSYSQRYQIFLDRLKKERLYDSVTFVLSKSDSNIFSTDEKMNPQDFFVEFEAYIKGYVKKRKLHSENS